MSRPLIATLLCGGMTVLAANSSTFASKKPIERFYRIGEQGTMGIMVSPGWKVEARRARKGNGLDLSFSPSFGDSFSLQITAVANEGEKPLTGIESIRESLSQAARRTLGDMVDEKLEITTFETETARGAELSVLDQASANRHGDYRFMSQGLVVSGPASILYTVLAYEEDHKDRLQALESVRSIRVFPESFGWLPGPERSYLLRLPGKEWGISVDLPGFRLDQAATRPDGSGAMIRGFFGHSEIVLSLFLEREKRSMSTKRCRSLYFSKSITTPAPRTATRRWERGPLAMGEYIIEAKKPIPFRQMHVHAYLAREDVCMDLHLSKLGFEEEHRPQLETILDSVTIRQDDAGGT